MTASEAVNLEASIKSLRTKSLIHPKYRPDIDGLRALAVIAVVAYHAFPGLIRGGFIGVDIFFVISGFLISTIIVESLRVERFSFLNFYARRVNRIFPALILVLIASISYGWFVLLPIEYSLLGKHVAGGAGFISNFQFWGESGYFESASETKTLLHLWSLGIEEQFYIVWPLILWACWRLKLNLVTMLAALWIASFTLNINGVRVDAVATFFSPQTRFWELLTGASCAFVVLQQSPAAQAIKDRVGGFLYGLVFSKPYDPKGNSLRNFSSWLGVLLIVTGFSVITSDHRFPGARALMPALGAALLILAGPQAWLNRKVFSSRALVFVGLISFPLYLWHWPILSFLHIYDGESSLYLRIAAVFVSFVLAWLTYRFIERPLRGSFDANAKAIVLICVMAIVAGAGLFVVKTDGLPWRFPKIIQQLTGYTYDPAVAYRDRTCFLDAEQEAKDFSKCITPLREGKDTLYLWGDSHAAQLYPGYKKYFGEQYDIIQRSSSACPPILGVKVSIRPYCEKINDFILDEIKSDKPTRLVIAANWEAYDWTKIQLTINELHDAGVKNIEIIGPVPHWEGRLPHLLYQYFQNDPLRRVPTRMNFGVGKPFAELDPQLSTLAASLNVGYVSAKDILCDRDGCITRFGDTVESLMSWDSTHLTERGSEFLVSKFPGAKASN